MVISIFKGIVYILQLKIHFWPYQIWNYQSYLVKYMNLLWYATNFWYSIARSISSMEGKKLIIMFIFTANHCSKRCIPKNLECQIYSSKSFWWSPGFRLPSFRTGPHYGLRGSNLKIMEFTKDHSRQKVSGPRCRTGLYIQSAYRTSVVSSYSFIWRLMLFRGYW